MKNIIFILKIIQKSSKFRILFQIINTILERLIHFLFFVVLIRFVLNGFSNSMNFREVFIIVIAVALIKIIFVVFDSFFVNIYLPVSNKAIEANIQKMIFSKIEDTDLECFDNPKFYKTYILALAEATDRGEKILESISNIIGLVFYISTTSYVIFTIDKLAILFVLIPLLLGGITTKFQNKLRYDFDILAIEAKRKKEYSHRIYYSREYVTDIKFTNIFRVINRNFSSATDELMRLIRIYGKKKGILTFIFLFSNEILTDTMIFIYASYNTLVTKNIFLGDFFVIIDSVGDIAWSFKELVQEVLEFPVHAKYISNLRSFLLSEPSIKNVDNPIVTKTFNDKIKLENVFLKYEDINDYVLKNINMTINKGDKIAIVGHNGAGKTTLTKLILRMYDPTLGNIYLDNQNIKNIDIENYREKFGVALQDFKIFALSAIENILLKTDILEEDFSKVNNAIEEVNMKEFFDNKNEGLQTILSTEIDENGVELSLGQKQKIALARILSYDAPLIILDEPSSSLDPIAEHEIYETMYNISNNKTLILISHRLSQVMNFNKIYYMENGEILEEGTHSELMKLNSKYAHAYNIQAKNYR